MSGDIVQVDYGLLNSVADNLTGEAGTIQQYVVDLQNNLKLLYQTWGSTNNAAATAMQIQENQLKSTVNEIAELVTNWASTTRNASADQAAGDQQMAQWFSA
jgi:uncharacterized protein YukE